MTTLSRRDEFALRIAEATIQADAVFKGHRTYEDMCVMSIKIADAMLAKLDEKEKVG